MLIINRKSNNPYFNLATEEYLVKNIEEPCFMIWQNNPSVIIGKHQNPLKEVNLAYTEKESIPIIRRISGGGTVYHDLGNINYSFIDFGQRESLVNFTKYSLPILQLLNNLNVKAYLDGKSDLKIDGYKFSGNASHVHKNKVLHHGTLLFNSNLAVLNESIRIKKNYITDKAVKSNRSEVTNISEYLHEEISADDFKELIIEYIKETFPDAKITDLTKTEEEAIHKLATEKYQSWDWNFGYSPRYYAKADLDINGKKIEFTTEVYKGFIKNIQPSSTISEELKNRLLHFHGLQHQKELIKEVLDDDFFDGFREVILGIL